MEWHRYVVVSLSLLSGVRSQSFLKMQPTNSESPQDVSFGRKMTGLKTNDDSYCESWKFTVENNDAGAWSTVPSRCVKFVKNYVTGDRYLSDSKFAAADSLAFAKSVIIAADGKDCWIFDIDETLLSNLPYYAAIGYGKERALQKLHCEKPTLCWLQQLEKASIKGESDKGTKAIIYKSKKRKELEAEGYRIHGSSGDQWSDLLGNATAIRSFKLPNPLYFISCS